ncbi:DUF7373 family lipoprotein [Nocardia caishijiensis]|nr:hypothetical protein [Nocardia caishijiensis]
MTVPELSALSTGKFRTVPQRNDNLVVRRKADAFSAESRRMLAYLAQPTDIDPEVDILETTEIFGEASDEDDAFARNLPTGFAAVAARHRVVGGVLTIRQNYNQSGTFTPRGRKAIFVGVLRLPDEDAARAVGAELAAAASAQTPGQHSIPVPDLAQTLLGSADDELGDSFTAHGKYVVITRIRIPGPDAGLLATQTARILDKQFTLLDEYVPSRADDIPGLPELSDELAESALPSGDGLYGRFGQHLAGVYGPRAHAHLERNSSAAATAFADAGVDLIARDGGIVYRTRDLAAAFRLQLALTEPEPTDQPVPTPARLVDARCFESKHSMGPDGTYFSCVVVYGRYVGVVRTRYGDPKTEWTLHQAISAQYAIIARSE